MKLLDAIRAAFLMIRAHKLRSFFTILGTVVGVTFLIAVITLIQGMNAYMEDEFAGQIYGVNSVTVRRTPSVQINTSSEVWRAWQRRPRLTHDDAAWLATRMETPGMLAISSSSAGSVESEDGRQLDGVRLVGASASYFGVRSMNIERGRVFLPQEDERGLPVAVVGHDIADALFAGTDPIGSVVRVRGFPYRIVGVLERQGTLFGMSMDNQVIAPATSRMATVVNPVGAIDEITYRVPEARQIPDAVAEIEGWMRIQRQLRPGEPSNFEVETAEASLSFWTDISRMLFIALPGLVGISLVVGAVVIMNIMLVSVTERTREIGLRKSLGARRQDIMRQFLIEAGTLSGLGGLLGIGLGAGLAALVSAVSPMPAQVAPWSIGLGLLLGLGVGIAAGAYPAHRAARLDPIEALGHE